MTELQHFGVKGMKWGVRKDHSSGSASSGSDSSTSGRHLTDTQKKVIAGTAIAAGAVAVALVLKNSGGLRMSDVPQAARSHEEAIRTASHRTAEALKRQELNRSQALRSSDMQRVQALISSKNNTAAAMAARRLELAKQIDTESRLGLLHTPFAQDLLKQHGEVSMRYLNAGAKGRHRR